MDTAIDLLDSAEALNLSNIRIQLIRLEDTITYHLIERVQFPLNRNIYEAGAVNIPDSSLSFFDWFLWQTERLHSLVRRYQSPDEYPFFPEALQTPILEPLHYPHILHHNSVNVNEKLKSSYIHHILPQACLGGKAPDKGPSQEHYGSCATQDVAALQALSRRIHFGKFVAESKFRQDSEKFKAMIARRDRAAIDRAITNEAVEAKVLERLRLKAKTFGTDPSTGAEGLVRIDADAVVAMYKNHVIPLTKEVEVEYLMQRLTFNPPHANGTED